MNYVVEQSELEAGLRDQRDHLRASAEAFDGGRMAESARLAVVVRVLVHDTGRSHSLLGLLRLKDRIQFGDSGKPLPPDEDVPPPAGGGVGSQTRSIGTTLAPLQTHGGPWFFAAPLGQRPPHREIPFGEWWSAEISRGPSGVFVSRQDVVLALANWEGGAHVDPILAEDWAAITRAGSFRSVAPGGTEVLNPVPALMRQIAFEVDWTMTRQVPAWTGKEAAET